MFQESRVGSVKTKTFSASHRDELQPSLVEYLVQSSWNMYMYIYIYLLYYTLDDHHSSRAKSVGQSGKMGDAAAD